MSQMAKAARSAMKAKIAKLVAPTKGKVDGSSWSPEPSLDADAKREPAPTVRRKFKAGGKVTGDKSKMRADKSPRKRDHKALGGLEDPRAAAAAMMQASNRAGVPTDLLNNTRLGKSQVSPYKKGGKVSHDDKAEDLKLIKQEVKSSAIKPGKAKGGWIKGAIKHPGALHKELGVPKGEKIPAKKLSAATHSNNALEAKRARLAETMRGFHAKERASGGVVNAPGGAHADGGRMPRKSGGRAGKGKTNINIVIAQPHDGQGQQPPPPQGQSPQAMPVPVPPPQMGGAPAAPPPAMSAPPPPPMMPPGRQNGGRVGKAYGGPMMGHPMMPPGGGMGGGMPQGHPMMPQGGMGGFGGGAPQGMPQIPPGLMQAMMARRAAMGGQGMGGAPGGALPPPAPPMGRGDIGLGAEPNQGLPPPAAPMGRGDVGIGPAAMPRAAGGRTYPHMTAGALGGEARLEKKKAYGLKPPK